MFRSFSRWLDELPDRTIDRVSRGLIVAVFLLVAAGVGSLVVMYG